MVKLKRSPLQIGMILAGNLVPVFGCLFLQWSLRETFLFYAAELCVYELFMLPKIVLFTFQSDEYYIESVIKKIFIALCWLAFHLGLFFLTLMFLMHTAYATSASTASMDWPVVTAFALGNIIPLVILLADYTVIFMTDFGRKARDEESYYRKFLMEMSLVYLVIPTVLGIINGMANLFALDIQRYQLAMLSAVVILKSGMQILGIEKKRKQGPSGCGGRPGRE